MKAKDNKKLLSPLFLATLALLVFVGFAASPQAVEGAGAERGFLLFFKYPSVTTSVKEKIDLDLMIINTGQKKEEILLSVIPDEKAKGWDVGLETKWPKMQIHSVSLLTKDPDDSVTLGFYLMPPEDIEEGKYSFIVKGISRDKKIQRSATLTISLEEKEAVTEEISQNIELVADYPSIENPAGKPFKFQVTVKNNTDKSMIVDLGADVPYGWRAHASPRWEEDKRISSLKTDAKGSENLLLTLVPPPNVSKGDYLIKFAVKSEDKVETIDLKAIVTGTYSLKMRTETGRLNLEAIAGEEKNLSMYLWNEGSAPVEDVSFFSIDSPKDWEISFDPEKISSIPPYQEVEKPEKVKVSIVSPPRALPGDYMVTVRSIGKQDQTNMDLRVTVKRSTLWGWLGIGIVLVIIASLVGVFIKLGRR